MQKYISDNGLSMNNIHISLMEKSDIQESASVLSVAMLNNPLHVAVFQGKGKKECMGIEKMFCELRRVMVMIKSFLKVI